jgi:hypothetical protein
MIYRIETSRPLSGALGQAAGAWTTLVLSDLPLRTFRTVAGGPLTRTRSPGRRRKPTSPKPAGLAVVVTYRSPMASPGCSRTARATGPPQAAIPTLTMPDRILFLARVVLKKLFTLPPDLHKRTAISCKSFLKKSLTPFTRTLK